jgi:hypothetical protein
MTVKVVTTLHKDGYDLYGKDFVKTWETFFPKDWEIEYYAENHNPEFGPRINVLDFNTTCPEWNDFYNYVKTQTDNIVDKKQINRYKKALRWSFKMFTLLHALETTTTRYVLWIDADVYAIKSPSKNWIEHTLDNNLIAGQLEHVKGFPHVETGLLIIDTHHNSLQKLISWIRTGYVDKLILNEPKPWDGAWIGKLFETSPNLCKRISMLHHEKGNAHPFSDTGLRWLVHKVGDFKFDNTYSGRSGRTTETELI